MLSWTELTIRYNAYRSEGSPHEISTLFATPLNKSQTKCPDAILLLLLRKMPRLSIEARSRVVKLHSRGMRPSVIRRRFKVEGISISERYDNSRLYIYARERPTLHECLVFC